MSRNTAWAGYAGRTDHRASRAVPRVLSRSVPPPDPLRVLFDVARDVAAGRTSPRICMGVVFPAACLCFWGGAVLSLVNLPAGFDYGRCVISRLCSSHHNPAGYLFMSSAMMLTPVFLWCFSSWLMRSCEGCSRLRNWGWGTTRIGLVSTALVGAERGWFPTHWTRFEALHFVFAALAFGCLWLGLAMLEGASEAEASRVRWRWLYRPSWYLVLTLLPILVVFAMCAPMNLVPGARSLALSSWPQRLVFLRTITFWQWYLVFGLGLSYGASGWARQRRIGGVAAAPASGPHTVRWQSHATALPIHSGPHRGGRHVPGTTRRTRASASTARLD